jgi:hypothetical protein
MQPGHEDDISAVQIVSNVKVRMQPQHSITPPSLHDLIGKVLPLLLSLFLTTVVSYLV